MRSLTIIFLFGLLVLPGIAQKPKPSGTRPKPAATSQKKPDEQAEWKKASELADAAAIIEALQKFNAAFPKSAKRTDALGLIANARVELGNAKIAAGDIDGAAAFFNAAATDAPKPVPEQLFTDTLSKLPATLYFRGARDHAFEVARILEERSDASVGQLLKLAAFYMTVENGTEAKRVAEKAIVLEPNSSAAYQTLGLACRIDFELDESAAAYAKALELEPGSMTARRGLAEMKRSLGKADDAITLYREMLTADSTDPAAQTGLVLALFDAGKRSDAEAEMAKILEANPANVFLMAGAAYWYAAHNEADKAVELGQKAIAADPRFIWSHIALARGLLMQKKTADAEVTLLKARRFGNFPTLEYEIATVRLAAGFYREAVEELAKSFSVSDGSIQTKLGRRVTKDSKNFTELVGFERRASIFAPTAADDPDNSARLTALLVFKQELDSADPKAEAAAKAADEFVSGDDKMKVHRQIFAATQLLDKKVAVAKALELAKAASGNIEAGIDVPNPAVAVMANELYETRSIAAEKDQYIAVPDVPRTTLMSILRGEVEDLNGWAQYLMDDPVESVNRLKRAVNILPVNSSWWRTSMWRLGSALTLTGNNADALDAYIKCYKSGSPDAFRYGVIESLYKKANGTTDGLEAKIGPNPVPPAQADTVAQKAEPTPDETKPAATPEPSPQPSPESTPESKSNEPKVEATPAATQEPSPQPSPEPSPTPSDATTNETKPTSSPDIKPCTITASEESLTLENGGGDLAVIIGVEGDADLAALTAISSSPEDVNVRREPITGVKARALFVVRSTSAKAGLYQVRFELPCGMREILVKVR